MEKSLKLLVFFAHANKFLWAYGETPISGPILTS